MIEKIDKKKRTSLVTNHQVCGGIPEEDVDCGSEVI